MESDVAVKSIEEIEKNENVKVGVIIIDDDTTTIHKIQETISIPVLKWSDLNHTKNMLGTVCTICRKKNVYRQK